MKPIPFSPPDITEEEAKEVTEALLSGWITTGPRVKQLEKVIAGFCNVANCACLNSQTACAEMALRLLGIGPGDEVIVPAYTYTASCSVICHVGATPIMVDSQKDCIEMDYSLVAKAINERTKAIIPVDVGGIPCDYDKIIEIIESKKHLFKPNNDLQKAIGRIAIIADSAHSLGASYKGRRTGSLADFTAFSFHAVKNMTTAEGGALTWKNIVDINSDEIYRKIQLMSLHGQSKDAFAKTKLGSWEYDVIGPWYKCNMTDVAAAIGLVQMRRYEGMLKKRRAIVQRYNEAFSDLNITPFCHVDKMRVSSFHIYGLRLSGFSIEQRNKFIELMAENGVATNVHFKPLPLFTAYKNLGFDIKDYPNAYKLYSNEITLPLYTKLTDDYVERIIFTFRKVYEKLSSKK